MTKTNHSMPAVRAPRRMSVGLSACLCLAWTPGGVAHAEEGGLAPAWGVLTPAMLGQGDVASTATTGAGPSAVAASEERSFWDGMTFRGYLETSYTYNSNRPKSPADTTENAFRIFDTRNNEFMLNQVELLLSKDADKDNPVGFIFNPLIGQSADGTQANGLFSDSETEIDLVQAAVHIRFLEGHFTVGKFVTTAGAEVIYSPDNWNFSRSFLFGLAIPFTHTGVMYTLPITEQLVAKAGFVNGWDQVRDINNAKTILTSLVVLDGKPLQITGNFFYSFSEQTDESDGRTLLDIVALINATDRLSFYVNFDLGAEDGAASGGGYAVWHGLAVAAKVVLTNELYVAGRVEYFNDGDGARTGIAGNPVFAEGILTLGYQPYKNLLIRGELRYDFCTEKAFFRTDDADPVETPPGSGDFITTFGEAHQTTAAIDVILLF